MSKKSTGSVKLDCGGYITTEYTGGCRWLTKELCMERECPFYKTKEQVVKERYEIYGEIPDNDFDKGILTKIVKQNKATE